MTTAASLPTNRKTIVDRALKKKKAGACTGHDHDLRPLDSEAAWRRDDVRSLSSPVYACAVTTSEPAIKIGCTISITCVTNSSAGTRFSQFTHCFTAP